MISLLLLAFADNTIPATEPLRSINTSLFQIVYPASAEPLAQRSAAALEIMIQEIYKNRRISSIPKLHLTLNHLTPTSSTDVELFPLHGRIQGVLSNNHPFRKGYASSWLETSMFDVSWEAAQYERSFYGGSILYWLFMGDYAWNLTHNYAQPKWFLEGETRIYSQLWMGSAASMPRQKSRTAAYIEATSKPSFHQLTIGSNKRFLPEQEEIGQLLVDYGMRTYSDNLWNMVVPYSVSNWYGVHSFETSLLRYGPSTFKSLFSGSIGDLKKTWETGRKTRRENSSIHLLPPQKEKYHYHYPKRGMNGNLYLLRDGLTDTGSIVVQKSPFTVPKKLVQLGQRSDLHFDEHGGYLIWTEQVRDTLWFNKAAQELILYDTTKKKKYTLTKNQTLYNPVFSPSGDQIAVLSMQKDGSISLEIKNNTGATQSSIPLPTGDHFDLSWEDELCWVHKSIDYGNRIFCTPTPETEATVRYDWTWMSLSDPVHYKDHLFFVSSVPTGEELHAWDGFQEYRVAASAYGSIHPFIDKENQRIILVEYDDAGQKPVHIPLVEKLWIPIEPRQEEHPKPPEYLPYQSFPYGRWNGLFRLHSWSPNYNATYGIYQIGLRGSNVRDSLGAELQATWDSLNDTLYYQAQGTYKEFWPELTLSAEIGEKSTIITPGIFGLGEAVGISWHTEKYAGTLALPTYIQKGAFQGSNRFYLTASHEQNEDHKLNNLTLNPEELGIPTATQHQIRVGIQSHLYQDQAHSHLAPPLGYEAKAEYQQILDGDAGVFAHAKIWLPSIFPTHSISAKVGYSDLPFHEDNHTLLPIGTINRNFNSLNYVDFRYTLPLANPDFAMDGWIYFRRVRGSVFFERSLRNDTSIGALGVSIDVDAHLLRYSLPLTRLGIDIAYHQQRNQLIIQPKITLYEF